jgi:hypothetical protein
MTDGYITPRTNDPAEAAMAAAENACRVPLGGDSARFIVLDFVAQAMNALDKVSRYDDVTHALVREKIGKAQARAGWQ